MLLLAASRGTPDRLRRSHARERDLADLGERHARAGEPCAGAWLAGQGLHF